MSPLPKIELRLNEENELSFKMEIQGSTSDASGTKTKYRFTITEFGTDKGWVYPVLKEKNNIVKVNIPALKETFSADKKYFGKLEVIMGNLYFTPTELMVYFKEPLKVKTAAVTSISKNIPTNTDFSDDEENENLEDNEVPEEDSEEENSQEVPEEDSEEEEEEEDVEDIEKLEKPTISTFRPPAKHKQNFTSTPKEDKIDLDSYFIDNSEIIPSSTKRSETKLNSELIKSISDTLFSTPSEKDSLKNKMISAIGFDQDGPSEEIKKSFTASGIPEKQSMTSQKDHNFSLPETHIMKSQLSQEAMKLKENFKKAFREALSFDDSNINKISIANKEPVKKQEVFKKEKTNNFLEEAKKLLLAQQNKNKIETKRPKSLKDLFDN